MEIRIEITNVIVLKTVSGGYKFEVMLNIKVWCMDPPKIDACKPCRFNTGQICINVLAFCVVRLVDDRASVDSPAKLFSVCRVSPEIG